jgi:hypothetical protein
MTELPDFLRDVVAMVISEERKRERAELAEAIGQLRAEFNVQRAAEKTDVIDLPALPLRRKSDAA